MITNENLHCLVDQFEAIAALAGQYQLSEIALLQPKYGPKGQQLHFLISRNGEVIPHEEFSAIWFTLYSKLKVDDCSEDINLQDRALYKRVLRGQILTEVWFLFLGWNMCFCQDLTPLFWYSLP